MVIGKEAGLSCRTVIAVPESVLVAELLNEIVLLGASGLLGQPLVLSDSGSLSTVPAPLATGPEPPGLVYLWPRHQNRQVHVCNTSVAKGGRSQLEGRLATVGAVV